MDDLDKTLDLFFGDFEAPADGFARRTDRPGGEQTLVITDAAKYRAYQARLQAELDAEAAASHARVVEHMAFDEWEEPE